MFLGILGQLSCGGTLVVLWWFCGTFAGVYKSVPKVHYKPGACCFLSAPPTLFPHRYNPSRRTVTSLGYLGRVSCEWQPLSLSG